MSYAKRLERALIEADMKAAELSRRTGISKACLSQYMSGVSIPREDRQELIADVLGKERDWFFPQNRIICRAQMKNYLRGEYRYTWPLLSLESIRRRYD